MQRGAMQSLKIRRAQHKGKYSIADAENINPQSVL